MAFAKLLKTRAAWPEFGRFFFTGCLSFVIDLALLAWLIEVMKYNYLIANAISVIIGISINYWLSIKWVFVYRKFTKITVEASLFIVICLIGLVLNEGLLWVCVTIFSIHYAPAKVIVAGMIFILSYTMKKVVLFS